MADTNRQLPQGCALIPLKPLGDERGSLVAIEEYRHIPFAVERVYYIHRTERGVVRGMHAHRGLRQLAVAVSGSCSFMMDDGVRRETVRLDNPNQGLLLGPLIWREMSEFSPDCVLLVLADAVYDEADYIRDYDEFCSAARDSRRR